MGSTNSKETFQNEGPRKKIVVVGASFAGSMIVRKLQELDPNEIHFDFLFIDNSEHFEFTYHSYKWLASEKSFMEHSIKFEKAMKSYRSKRVNFMQGNLTGIDHLKN